LLTFVSARQLIRRSKVSDDPHQSGDSVETCCINATAHPARSCGKLLKCNGKSRKPLFPAVSGPATLIQPVKFI